VINVFCFLVLLLLEAFLNPRSTSLDLYSKFMYVSYEMPVMFA
jgi:hypothetical protein